MVRRPDEPRSNGVTCLRIDAITRAIVVDSSADSSTYVYSCVYVMRAIVSSLKEIGQREGERRARSLARPAKPDGNARPTVMIDECRARSSWGSKTEEETLG